MTTGCQRRARNSLSLKKFTDRLDRGLPIFVAYGEGQRSVLRHDNCRNLYWHPWTYPRGTTDGAEFINVTCHHPSFVYEDYVSLKDMNVYRNKYNKIFAFRTLKAAKEYIASSAVVPYSWPKKISMVKKLVDKITGCATI